ncbi:MAG: FeoC-like transcriptional regulator [Rhodocyclaceae bacterium]|nr:FeoC-like transcriptional regulator [Rhodocyclaceae bacterium]
MILEELGNYLQQHRRASLTQLGIALGASPEALRGMLQRLERKGRVRRLPPPQAACGGSCCRCDAAVSETWAWAADDGEPVPGLSCPSLERPV